MRKKLEISRAEIKNILVIRPDALGDVVLTLPAIETLKKEFPAARITVLAKPYTAPLLKQHPAVARTIFDYELQKYHFDLAVNYFNEPKETWAVFKAKIPWRLGDSSRLPFGLLNNLKVFRRWNDQTRHEVEFNLDLLAPLNIAVPIEKAGFKVDEGLAESLFKKFHLSSHYLLIGCHLGAGGTNNKSWDIQEYAKTINMLAERPNTRIILLGGPEANDRAREIQKFLTCPTINTVGVLTISEFIALASKLNLYLGTDTGPTHLAAALNVPMVVLFLSKRAKPLRWGPWGTRHLVIRNFSSCARACFPPNCKETTCTSEIKAEAVIAACRQVISGNGVKTRAEAFQHWCQNSISVAIVNTSAETAHQAQAKQLLNLLQSAGYQAALISETNPKTLLDFFIAQDTSVIHQIGNRGSLAIKIAWQLTGSYLSNRALLVKDQGQAYASGQELVDYYVSKFRQAVL